MKLKNWKIEGFTFTINRATKRDKGNIWSYHFTHKKTTIHISARNISIAKKKLKKSLKDTSIGLII